MTPASYASQGVPVQSKFELKKQAAILLVTLAALNTLSLVARFILPSVQMWIQSEFRLSDSAVGLLSSTFFLVFMVSAPLASWLGRRRRPSQMIFVAVFIWSFFMLLAALSKTYVFLILTHGLLAFGEAIFAVFAPTMIAGCYPAHQRNTAFTFYFLTIPIGMAIAFGLGSFAQPQSWRLVFLIVSVIGFFCALFANQILRNSCVEASPETGSDEGEGSLWSLCRNVRYIALVVHATCASFAAVGVSVWLPTFLASSRGMSLTAVNSRLSSLTVIGGAIGIAAGGIAANQWQKHDRAALYLVSAISVVGAALAASVVIYGPSSWTFYAVGVTDMFIFMNVAPANAAGMNVVPEQLRAVSVALSLFVAHALGDGISPTFIGWIGDHLGLRLGMELALAPLLISGVALLLGGRLERRMA